MPAYFFEELVHLTGEEFDQKFKSMQSMYKTEQGDPIERLREMAAETSDEAPSTILSGAGKTRRLMEGRFYFFKYLPKMRNELPYYDMFPAGLCTGINREKGYFSMLNFHYMPPKFRAELMDAIYPFVIFPNVEGKDIGTSIRARVNTKRLDYNFMKKRMDMRSFLPMWKRYDFKRVVGQFLYIPPIGWDTIVMLPLAMPRKSGINRIWMDSQMERRMRKKSDRTKAKYKRYCMGT